MGNESSKASNKARASAIKAFKEAVLVENYGKALELVSPAVAEASYTYKAYEGSSDYKRPSLIFLVDNHITSGLFSRKKDVESRKLIDEFSKVFLALLKAGATFNVATELRETTPLHAAARWNLIEVMEELIKRGADVNAKDDHRTTPIFEACKGGAYEAFELLRQTKDIRFNVHETDKDGRTMFHEAVSAKNLKIVQSLIDNGANVNTRDGYPAGSTPLHSSARAGEMDAIRLLVACGANVNAKDDKWRTPLHYAASCGNFETVQLLLEIGANPTITSLEEKSALQLAMSDGHIEVANLIRDFAPSRSVIPDPTLATEELTLRKTQSELWNNRAKQAVAFIKFHQPTVGPDFDGFVETSFETWGFAGFARMVKDKFGEDSLPPDWKSQLESGQDVEKPPAWWKFMPVVQTGDVNKSTATIEDVLTEIKHLQWQFLLMKSSISAGLRRNLVTY